MDQACMLPRILPYHLLEEITNSFSEDRELGSGMYGKVYLGLNKDGEKIAVKILHPVLRLDDEQFEKEYHNLENLQHQNIVRLVGYCNETRREFVPFEGRRVLSEVTHRALCFEYMQNGSLDNCLSDEPCGYDWHTCYAIIKGICKGLQYLHEELRPPIFHLDLKPANILLSENMVAKIADFGLSKLMGAERTCIATCPIGTIGYLPPEYMDRQVISNKLDIFSLGVIIIKIMAGHKGYWRSAEISSDEFVDLVHGKWRNRLQATSMDALESCCEQIKRCATIALTCVEADRHKRPTIGNIVNELNETETIIQFPNVPQNTTGSSMNQHSMQPNQVDNNDILQRQAQGLHKYRKNIDVKILPMPGVEEQFEKESHNLGRLQHLNIVKLLAGKKTTNQGFVSFKGKRVLSEVTQMKHCFEDMHNGSLENFLSEKSSGHDWHSHYAIIKGICKGLQYLHEELEPPVFHLDLKPSNILLDEDMVAKIANFGLSTLMGEDQACSASPIGTIGYLPPEYINQHVISNKLDIFSLGVIIIEIMAGSAGYYQSAETCSEEFIDLVHAKWRHKLQVASMDLVELYCEQIKRCVTIALTCLEEDRHKRPTIGNIVNELNEADTIIQSLEASQNIPGSSMEQRRWQTYRKREEDKRERKGLNNIEKMASSTGKPKTREDQAREVYILIKDRKPCNYTLGFFFIRMAFLIPGGLRCIFYNATGDTLYQVADHDWGSQISGVRYHSGIVNGGADVREPSNSPAAAVYRGKNKDGEDQDYLLAWHAPQGAFSRNKCYCEIGAVDNFQKRWPSLGKKLLNSGYDSNAKSHGCEIQAKIGTGILPEFIAIISYRC